MAGVSSDGFDWLNVLITLGLAPKGLTVVGLVEMVRVLAGLGG